MATDVQINPVTRDFVDAPDGSWVEVDDSSTAVFVQLDSREGKWWGDPSAGSRNKEILESDLPTPDAIRDSSKRALLAMARAGAISDVFVTIATADNLRGYGELDIDWRDRSTNKAADLAYSPLGGHP